ncbi:hypothetical protein [Pseudomonas sp. Marseille-P9899]|uniref:hypothetical protein n=1 Tax=Pseudomonas sp. Marseille-P9899 TaxID=2730401 RepID=UPI00158A9382|nr:hypothetical protein [Pseudomonas sp. Marseille-P9899]
MQYRLDLQNALDSTENFIVFQAPPSAGGQVFVQTNVLANCQIGPGEIVTLAITAQPFACAQMRTSPLEFGQVSGGAITSMPINLTEIPFLAGNSTALTVDPLGFSPAIPTDNVCIGAFLVASPAQVAEPINLGVGYSIECGNDSTIVLSGYWLAQPNQVIECEPAPVFYVAAAGGSSGFPPEGFVPGAVIDFAGVVTGAQICDFSRFPMFTVIRNSGWVLLPSEQN